MRVISPTMGAAIADRLREKGYAVTEIAGRGKDGVVNVILVIVLRKHINDVRDQVMQVDESAFMTSEDLKPVRRGFWRA